MITKEKLKQLRESYEERKGFFYGAIEIQQNAWSERYADEKLEESCCTLAGLNFCKRQCERCALQIAHDFAIAEIKEGKRLPIKQGRTISISVRKDGTIRITQKL